MLQKTQSCSKLCFLQLLSSSEEGEAEAQTEPETREECGGSGFNRVGLRWEHKRESLLLASLDMGGGCFLGISERGRRGFESAKEHFVVFLRHWRLKRAREENANTKHLLFISTIIIILLLYVCFLVCFLVISYPHSRRGLIASGACSRGKRTPSGRGKTRYSRGWEIEIVRWKLDCSHFKHIFLGNLF